MSTSLMAFSSVEEALQWGKMIASSQFCPKAYVDRPQDIIIAVQFGAEVGLKPLQSLHNISVINGKPTIYGDAMLAICKASPEFEYIKETFEKTSEGLTAICEVKRKSDPLHRCTYSESDAKGAGLLNRTGPWQTNKKRMLQMRARGFALRDVFPHLLKGLISSEEAQDYPKTYVASNVPEIEETKIDKETGEIINVVTSFMPPTVFISREMIDEIEGLAAELALEHTKIMGWLEKMNVKYVNDLTMEQGAKMLNYLRTIKESRQKENVVNA